MRLRTVLLLVAVVVWASGCATKSYVDESVAPLGARLDEHNARLNEQNTRINELTDTSRQALERATDAGVLAQGKFLYTIVFTNDEVTFDTDKFTLSEDSKSRLTELASGLKADNKNVYLEIQGHTDSTGSPEYNQWLGLKRAEAVRRQLHSQGVALDRMAIISYGEDAPTEPNSTADGRALNRRVEIVVLN
jgi:outer membrane protein OmpA-like peptidoglycan-associated protein